MTPSFLPPKPVLLALPTFAACVVALLSACSQTPVVQNEDPAVLQPRPIVVAPVAPVPPVAAIAPAHPAVVAPLAPLMPAIPPKDGAATSVRAATGAVAPSRSQLSAGQIATAASPTPTGTTRYECVKGNVGVEARVAIVFPENSGRICARFPAMGPCQYEREACRASGGRVIRFDGAEITKEVESEYDKQVQRFRLNAG